jgi:hypothetical protein
MLESYIPSISVQQNYDDDDIVGVANLKSIFATIDNLILTYKV